MLAAPRSPTRAGFTLVELLTVMIILALLVSLLLPAIFAVRDAARRAACQQNMKQLATALMTYAADNDSKFPPRLFTAGEEDPLKITQAWKDWFNRKGLPPELLFCPAKHRDAATYSRERWAEQGLMITDYEILVGAEGLGSADVNKDEEDDDIGWIRMDRLPDGDMIVADMAGKKDGQWIGNHMDTRSDMITLMGRNVLYSDWRVEWVPVADTETRSYYTDATGYTHYLPDKGD